VARSGRCGMSATNRGSTRIAHDFYKTPSWCVRRLLETGALPPGGFWADLCCGDGAIVRALKAAGVADRILASDIRPEVEDAVKAAGADHFVVDDLTTSVRTNDAKHRGAIDVAITNPPYGDANVIVPNMLKCADYVAVLVRQGFVGHDRAAWMRGDMPDTYELPDRPSFAASLKCGAGGYHQNGSPRMHSCGWSVIQAIDAYRPSNCPGCFGAVKVTTTDAADYCWLVWPLTRSRRVGRREILASTSLEERKLG
jgi:hypothetical protein